MCLYFGHPPKFYLKNIQAKAKHVSLNIWNQVAPPPLLLKNVKMQAEKFLKSFGIR